MNKINTLKYAALVFFLQVGQLSAAEKVISNPLKSGTDTVPKLLELIIKSFIVPIGGVIVTFMFIYTGFLFVMAQGNEQKITTAKETLKNTIIGAAIVLGAFAISVIISTTLGQISDAIPK